MSLIRRLRAASVLMILWSVVWLVTGLGVGFLVNMQGPTDTFPPPLLLFPLVFTIWGAGGGLVFSVLLAFTEHNRRLESLSSARLTTWGAVGGAALPVVLLAYSFIRTGGDIEGYWVGSLVVVGLSGLIGAACASATLALARRSPSADRIW